MSLSGEESMDTKPLLDGVLGISSKYLRLLPWRWGEILEYHHQYHPSFFPSQFIKCRRLREQHEITSCHWVNIRWEVFLATLLLFLLLFLTWFLSSHPLYLIYPTTLAWNIYQSVVQILVKDISQCTSIMSLSQVIINTVLSCPKGFLRGQQRCNNWKMFKLFFFQETLFWTHCAKGDQEFLLLLLN